MANNRKGLDPAVSVQGPATVGALELQVEGGSSGYPADQACNGYLFIFIKEFDCGVTAGT